MENNIKQTLNQQIEEKRREMDKMIDTNENYDDILAVSKELDALIAQRYAEEMS